MSNTVHVTPSVLTWARKNAHYSLDELLKHFPKLQEWEDGKSRPTYRQLENLSKEFDCAMTIFFFPEPPNMPPIEKQFRTLPEKESGQLSPKMIKMVKKAKVYQLNIAELAPERSDTPSHKLNQFRLSVENIGETATKLRNFLGISIEEQMKWRNSKIALQKWRGEIEKHGVFIFKDAFKDNNYSGFCLYDENHPLVYINNSNSVNRQIFTLFHELAHLFFKTGGIDKINQSYTKSLTESHEEVLCNRFAASFLVPDNNFKKHYYNLNINDASIQKIARTYSVSREVILRKYLDFGKITNEFYERKADEYRKQYLEMRKNNGGGGNYYLTQNVYLSQNYKQIAFENYHEGQISEHQLIKYLNINIKSLLKFETTFLESITR